MFLATASGSGIPALFALVVFGLAVIARSVRHARRHPDDRLVVAALLTSVLGYIVTQCFMMTDVSSTIVVAVVIGALVGITGEVAVPERCQPGLTQLSTQVDVLQ